MNSRLKEFIDNKDSLKTLNDQKDKIIEVDVQLIKHEILNMAD